MPRRRALHDDLMERVLASENRRRAWKRVKANQGAPGVAGRRSEDFAEFARSSLPAIRQARREGTYRPQPVRRVTIPKPNGGERLLGIPMLVSYCTSLPVMLGMMEPGQPRWPEVSIPPLG